MVTVVLRKHVILISFYVLFVSLNYLGAMFIECASSSEEVVIIHNPGFTDFIFNLWKMLSIKSLQIKRDDPCFVQEKLYFNVISEKLNLRGQIFVHPLSNFYSQAEDPELKVLRIDGFDYITSENYFQAKRYQATAEHRLAMARSEVDLSRATEIAIAPSPGKAWYYGKTSADMIEKEDEVRIMKQALSAKFAQNPQLKKILLETNNMFLVYNHFDLFWGYGSMGEGANVLGLLLMQLRMILRLLEP